MNYIIRDLRDHNRRKEQIYHENTIYQSTHDRKRT